MFLLFVLFGSQWQNEYDTTATHLEQCSTKSLIRSFAHSPLIATAAAAVSVAVTVGAGGAFIWNET